ncbi:MAG TPA: MlaD family protein [Puia sp.]|nr:MlaD family protein [Puia sp.]
MRTFQIHALLGLFVVIGVGLFVLAVFTVGSRQQTFSRTILVRIVFDDAEGLQKGNNVWLSGVKVGTVRRLALRDDNRVEVQLLIGRAEFSHLYRDASAKIGSDGLIGNRIIVLNGGSPAAGHFTEKGIIRGDRTLRTEDMLATLQENNKNLLAITSQVKVIVARINEGKGTIGLLLNDPGVAARLRRSVAGLQKTTENTTQLTERLNALAGQLDTGRGLVHQLASDTVLSRELQETIAALRAASSDIGVAAGNVRSGSRSFNDPRTPAGVLLTDDTLADDLRKMASHLRTSSEKLDDDLLALQHNFLLRGFFRKREKAQRDSARRALMTIRPAGEHSQ